MWARSKDVESPVNGNYQVYDYDDDDGDHLCSSHHFQLAAMNRHLFPLCLSAFIDGFPASLFNGSSSFL